jgi:hypothetical protein
LFWNPINKTIYDCINTWLWIDDNIEDIIYRYDVDNNKSVLWFIWSLWNTKNLVLNNKLKKNNAQVLNETEYKNIDFFFQNYFIIKTKIESINNVALTHNWINDILQNIIIFSLSYLPNEYETIMKKISIISNWWYDKIEEFRNYFLDLLDKVFSDWKSYLNNNLLPQDLDNLVESKKMIFNWDYLSRVKWLNISPNSYTEELLLSWEEINIVEVKIEEKEWFNTNFNVNWLQELLSIQNLWLNDKKPFIVISWWCASTDEKDIEEFYSFTKQALIKWIKEWANIAIVWNQSTAWILASKAILELKKANEFFASDSAWKVFAISTLWNMYLWEQLENDSDMEIPSVCDQIWINIVPEWLIKDETIIYSNYFKFLEWQNQFQNKLSKEKWKTHYVSNWWLFSIIEVLWSVRNNNSKIVLSKNWGRFSSSLAFFIDELKKNTQSQDLLCFNKNICFDSIDSIYNNLNRINTILKDKLPDKFYNEWIKKDFWDLNLTLDIFNDLKWENYDVANSINDLFIETCKKWKEKWLVDFNAKHFLYQLRFLEIVSEILSDASKYESISIL